MDSKGNNETGFSPNEKKIKRLFTHSNTFVISRGENKNLVKFTIKDSNAKYLDNQTTTKIDQSDYFDRRNNFSFFPPLYFENLKNCTFNGFISRRKSFKNNEYKAHIITDRLFQIKEDECLQKEKMHHYKTSEDLRLINLLPILTMKNYEKLKQIMSVVLLDSEPDFNKDNQKYFYGLVLEDNSALIINIEFMKIIYNFNINFQKRAIKGIYLKYHQKIGYFYLADGTLLLCNFTNKMGDRKITNPNIIYNLLGVEENMKFIFQTLDSGSNSLPFDSLYPHLNFIILEKFNALFDFEEFKQFCETLKKRKSYPKCFDKSGLPSAYLKGKNIIIYFLKNI